VSYHGEGSGAYGAHDEGAEYRQHPQRAEQGGGGCGRDVAGGVGFLGEGDGFTAPMMNGQGVANALNTSGKMEAAAGAMSPTGWDALAKATERTAPTMSEHGVANAPNALGKVEAASGAMSPAGWDALARAAEHRAPTMNEQNITNILNALGKIALH